LSINLKYIEPPFLIFSP